MSKTIILRLPDDFDLGKLITALGSNTNGLRILDASETVTVIDTPLPPAAKKARIGRRIGKSVCRSVMDHYTPAGIFLTMHAQSWVHQSGYDLKSASPALTALKKSGYIKQLESGKYQYVRPLLPTDNPKAKVAS